MPNSVLAQLLRKNSYDYDCLHQESILCEHAVVEGMYWRVPITSRGVLTGYQFRKATTKPTPDSMRAIRVRDELKGTTFYVAVADDGDEQDFTDACNACCDTVEPMDTVAFPTILIEEAGCADEDGNYSFFAIVPTPPPAGSVYKLSGSVNGVALPAAPAEGFATLADLETWADANWSTGDLDGVTLTGGKVTLNAGPTGKTGAIFVNVEQMFESNAPGALTSGDHYHLAATVNGEVLTALNGVADAALSTVATLANATAAYAKYGVWSVVAGKIRLVSTNQAISSATLVVTKLT
jgi:hypothetical protein